MPGDLTHTEVLSDRVTAGLDRLATGIGIFGPEEFLCYSNWAFRELRGLPQALCAPGTPLSAIVGYIAARGDYGPGEPASHVERRLAEIRRMRSWEVEQETIDGRRLRVNHTPLPDRGLMITYSDVTEARATARKLRENEERYTLVSEAVAEGIYDWNVELNTLFVSPRLVEMFGFQESGLNSQAWFALVHDLDRELYRDALRDCFRGTTAKVHCEYRILLHNGEYRWVEDHGLPVRDASGRAVRLVGAVSDVTKRKQTESALRDSMLELNRALQQQTATADVLKVISRSTFDLKAVLDTLVQSAARLCEAEKAFIFRREGEVLLLAANCGFSPEFARYRTDNPVTLDRGSLTGRTAIEAKAVHIVDVLEDAEYTSVESLRLGDFRTMLGVPMMREGAVVGVLALTRPIVQPFTDKQIELVTTFADQAVIAVENVRLFQEVQARTLELEQSLEYQTATSDVLNVISRSHSDLQPVLETILETACRLCAAYDAILMLREDDWLNISAHRGPIPVDFTKWPIGREWVAGRSVVDRKPIHVHDLSAEGDEFPQGQAMSLRFGHRTILAAPLLRGDAAIGVLLLRRKEVRPFSEKQIALLQTFADQAVIAIENVRLFEEVQARTKELGEALQQQTATSDVLKVISRSAFDLQAVLDTLIESAVKLGGATRGAIFFAERGILRLHSHFGLSAAHVELLLQQPLEISMGTLSGRPALLGRTIHVPDVLEDPDFRNFEVQNVANLRAYLGVPLVRDDLIFGVLSMNRPEPGPFTERQIELVTTFADQAVIAIENSKLLERLTERTNELSRSLDDLRMAQDRLIQSEKLASLGQLTAGIAHEIKNPLNFVNNFAELSAELMGELRDLFAPTALDENTRYQLHELTALISGNLDKVVQHGRRADSIVKNMLLHSRQGTGERRCVDLNAIVEESTNLAFHGARAETPGFNVTIRKDLDPDVGELEIFPQEFMRVLLNLISNGFYASQQRKSAVSEGTFEPKLTVSTKACDGRVEIRVRDNGAGIPDELRAKIFNPFFTTKPAGEGTGLGLSLSYDIITKQHGGSIDIVTSPGDFTEFVVTIPRSSAVERRSLP